LKLVIMKTNHLVLEYPSKHNFEKTVDALIKEAEKREWKVPAVHDLQLSLAKSGKTVKPVKVIEICKPAYSGQMLELNHERIMSVMMPCRISVYEKDDGLTYIALLNAGDMTSGLQENIAKIMKDASDDTLEIVKTVTF
jgi:uncharacterized protein (DUF302 family)